MNYNFRPQKFSDIVGSSINNKLLLSIAKHGGPSTIIMSGSYGCGKTTSARCFAKAVNCLNLTDDICCECEICKRSFDDDPCYTELDSAIFGNKDSIKELYDELTFVPKGKKRVVCIDEAHLISKEGQAALLKLFEDAPENIYYILCTTDKNKLLPTIISRSLTLVFNTKSKDDVISSINKIACDNKIILPDNVANLIALRSKGHMRDAHKLFEKYMLVGEEDFLNLEESCYNYLANYFAQVMWLVKNNKASQDDIKKRKSKMNELVNHIMNVPIALVKDDYQKLFLDLLKKYFDPDYNTEQVVSDFVRYYKNDIKLFMNLYKIALDDFTMNSFENDIRFQTALVSIYQRLLLGI